MAIFLIHRPGDSVGVATSDLTAGSAATGRFRDSDATIDVTAIDDVPLGHKIAVAPLAEGAPVVEYGVEIGVATQAIQPGQHVHVHNLKGQRWA
ncbi:MAG TPA: UxaA family hydrolase [Egicoccus sp.]|nr:UxaA family hydrolase [Egicoccus sp.]HSK22023.1 UxaA family hydrolase [Egicoccus sp.]